MFKKTKKKPRKGICFESKHLTINLSAEYRVPLDFPLSPQARYKHSNILAIVNPPFILCTRYPSLLGGNMYV